MSRETPAALWARLTESGLVRGEMPARSATHAPWFVRLMLGISGWIGALFLFGFVSMAFGFITEEAAASLVTGAFLCAGAAFLFRRLPENDFAAQFGLAVSIAGQVLVYNGLYKMFDSRMLPAMWTMAAVQALLFALVPSVLHRIWTAATGAFAAAWGIGELGLSALAAGLVTAAFAWVWLREFDVPVKGAMLRAAGHGLAIAAAVAVFLPGEWWPHGITSSPADVWFGRVLSAAVIVGVAVRLLGREGIALSSGKGRVALVGAAILALVSLRAPGVGLGTAILLIGFANGHSGLTGLGLLTLLTYLVRFYYAMDATLLVKSGFLAGAGAALLIARLAALRAWPADAPSEGDRA